MFHEDRLVFAGCTQYPQRIDGSNSSDYENFAPSDADGTVPANRSYSFSLNANTVNAVRWMQSDERGLVVGTAGGEWIVRASDNVSAISPTNVKAVQSTTYGSAQVQAVRVGKASLFIVRNGKKMRELAYVFTTDGFQAPDLTTTAEHVPGAGITQLAVTTLPYPVVWGVRADGQLVGMTYEREQEVAGWHRHVIGGYSDSGQSAAAIVESVASIPDSTGTRDELWIVVQRYINGGVKRYVELVTKYWENGDTLPNAVFLDASLAYSGAPATVISGLSHLEGQTVTILADGAVHPTKVVSGGSITLDRSASVAQVGLNYNSTAFTMSIEAGAADGVAQGKQQRVIRIFVRLWQSVGLSVWSNVAGTYRWVDETFRTTANQMSNAVPLFSGFKRFTYEDTWKQGPTVGFRQSQPLPSNVQLLVAQVDAQDAQ